MNLVLLNQTSLEENGVVISARCLKQWRQHGKENLTVRAGGRLYLDMDRYNEFLQKCREEEDQRLATLNRGA